MDRLFGRVYTFSVFQDKILNKYYVEFNNEMSELIDESAGEVSFDLTQQIWIDNYLEQVRIKLLELKSNSHDEEQVELIVTDVVKLQQTQSSMTRKQVIQELSKIWSKARKEGISIIKALYTEVKSEIIKQLATGGIDKIHHLMP